MPSIYIENYGCTANYDDGAIIAGLLTEVGHNVVKDIEDSDVIIINSCAVKNVTVNKIFSQIEQISKNYGKKKLVITGCMPAAEKDKLTKYIKLGVALVSSQNTASMPKVVEKILENEQVILIEKTKEIKLDLPKIQDSKIATVQIAQGCKSFCNFCSTKLAKGDLFSYPKEKIIEELNKYTKAGYKRINLTSTDNGCYGYDQGYNLVDLLKEIIKIEGEFVVRVGMANPEHVKKYYKELAEVYKNEKIMKFLHIPIQSGSDKILKEMNRKYTIEEFKEIVNHFRKEIPGITISTDIIVGYPTETQEDFEQTVELFKELKFGVINISKFASRPRTKASKLKQLDTKIIKERSVELTKTYKNS
ncbi:MAG TPA: tRNA (N(6)-L-threonylcarbamoyladenosine(37)-C(2))-methylthiotransferase [Candidatus Nanoarchaeia archaeon]|nr:tRNA (N(6)-L-threonylcarbamoyladenosine(37)-C(2))-methylthiotransferase [Candidatus Nanoarchaeia archaeon]